MLRFTLQLAAIVVALSLWLGMAATLIFLHGQSGTASQWASAAATFSAACVSLYVASGPARETERKRNEARSLIGNAIRHLRDIENTTALGGVVSPKFARDVKSLGAVGQIIDGEAKRDRPMAERVALSRSAEALGKAFMLFSRGAGDSLGGDTAWLTAVKREAGAAREVCEDILKEIPKA